jgi:hypothetical protein
MQEGDAIHRAATATDIWVKALSMALYRDAGDVKKLRSQLAIGTAVAVVQTAGVLGADRLRTAQPDWFYDTYFCDALVFWAALALAVAIVAAGIFVRDFFRAVAAVRRLIPAQSLLAEGQDIIRDMKRAVREKDNRRWVDALDRAKKWHRRSLPELLRSNADLEREFKASEYVGQLFATDWTGAEDWVPELDAQTGKLSEALRRLSTRRPMG